MKNAVIHPDQIIKVNFSGLAEALKPVIYEEGNQFFCLLGEEAKKGVSGAGETIEDPIDNWDNNLQIRVKAGGSER